MRATASAARNGQLLLSRRTGGKLTSAPELLNAKNGLDLLGAGCVPQPRSNSRRRLLRLPLCGFDQAEDMPHIGMRNLPTRQLDADRLPVFGVHLVVPLFARHGGDDSDLALPFYDPKFTAHGGEELVDLGRSQCWVRPLDGRPTSTSPSCKLASISIRRSEDVLHYRSTDLWRCRINALRLASAVSCDEGEQLKELRFADPNLAVVQDQVPSRSSPVSQRSLATEQSGDRLTRFYADTDPGASSGADTFRLQSIPRLHIAGYSRHRITWCRQDVDARIVELEHPSDDVPAVPRRDQRIPRTRSVISRTASFVLANVRTTLEQGGDGRGVHKCQRALIATRNQVVERNAVRPSEVHGLGRPFENRQVGIRRESAVMVLESQPVLDQRRRAVRFVRPVQVELTLRLRRNKHDEVLPSGTPLVIAATEYRSAAGDHGPQ